MIIIKLIATVIKTTTTKQQRKYSEEYTTRRGGGDIYSRISRSLQPSIIPHDLMIIEGFKCYKILIH